MLDGATVLTMNDDLIRIARRINWFEPPEKVVFDVDRFLVYFMQYCLDSDIPVMRRYFTDQQFRHALNNRPQGILDDRSAAYWDLILPVEESWQPGSGKQNEWGQVDYASKPIISSNKIKQHLC